MYTARYLLIVAIVNKDTEISWTLEKIEAIENTIA
jgi:hypothetical protein